MQRNAEVHAKPCTPHPITRKGYATSVRQQSCQRLCNPQAVQLFEPQTANVSGVEGQDPSSFLSGSKGILSFEKESIPFLCTPCAAQGIISPRCERHYSLFGSGSPASESRYRYSGISSRKPARTSSLSSGVNSTLRDCHHSRRRYFSRCTTGSGAGRRRLRALELLAGEREAGFIQLAHELFKPFGVGLDAAAELGHRGGGGVPVAAAIAEVVRCELEIQRGDALEALVRALDREPQVSLYGPRPKRRRASR